MNDQSSTNEPFKYVGTNGIKVVIGNNVTKIPAYLFSYANTISSVEFEEGSTCTMIGINAFINCTNLTSITIPDSVTSIGSYAFYNTSLTSVYITDIAAWCNISFANDYANPLSNETNLYLNGELVAELVIPDSVTSINSYAFSGFKSLTNITIPDSVTSIDSYAFYDCNGLTSVYITDMSSWCGVSFADNTANPLYYASNLYLNGELVAELVIPDSVTSINSYAFSGFKSLTNITIPDSVTSIDSYAFYDCNGLTSVTIPSSIIYIGDNAFYECNKLIEVINKSSLKINARSSDYGCVAYYALEVHNGKSKIVNNNYYLFYTHDGVNYLLGYVGNDVNLLLPERYNGSNYEIYQYAFHNCDNIISVTIPDSVTYIGKHAFFYCTSLTSVTIGNNVTSIGSYAFSGCSSLKSVTIGNSVRSIGSYAFFDSTSLKYIKYRGTSSQWNAISKGYYWNKCLYYAAINTIYFTMIYNYTGE